MPQTGGIYLDNNATTAPLPEVTEAVARVLEAGALNPSSVHTYGDRARELLEDARERVAGLVGLPPEEVAFTSGATEANHRVLSNLIHGAFRGFRLVTSAIEHSSIRDALPRLRQEGVPVTVLPVDSNGLIDLGELRGSIDPGRTLVSIHWANNETGVLQPLEEIADVCREAGAVLHSDAVQAVGKVEVDLQRVPVQLLSLSGHKFHGPVGTGALVGPVLETLEPPFAGGGQEAGVRPGTENLPGVVGLGVAASERQERFDEVVLRMRTLRDRLEQRLREEGILEAVAGGGVPRLPNTSNVRVRDVDGQALFLRLIQAGVCCSQSSACTHRKPEPSYVLREMGFMEEQAFRSLRFAVSELTTEEEVELAVSQAASIHGQLAEFFKHMAGAQP